jgi:hypothetical protein
MMKFRRAPLGLTLALLASVAAGCFSASYPDLTQRINQVNEVCGDLKNPESYPLSDQCIGLFGKDGPLVRRKGDLIVAEKKACTPSDSQFHLCETAMDGQPSCIRQKGEKVGDPKLDSDLKQCIAATADECGPVLDPADYDPSCKEAKADLKNFDADLQRAEMQQAFAPPPRVVTRPVIIQQAPAPNYLAPPWVPSPPVFTNCTNFGSTTNCITH